jgi:hypothetical protein
LALLLVLAVSVVLAACNGGGSSSTSSAGVNRAPGANAGTDQTVAVGSPVMLSGAASSDPDHNPLVYRWSFSSRPAGSKAVLSNANSVQPSFVPDVAGAYVLQLVVNDGKADSPRSTVTVTAGSTANRPPVANAGTGQSVNLNVTVTLNGSGSSDPDKDPLTYAWTLTSRPANSAAALSNATTVNPTFRTDVAGSYVARLIVNDGKVNSAASTVTVMAAAGNLPPIANAGINQNVTTGSSVALDGSASRDPEGKTLTYAWTLPTRPAGSVATLTGGTTARPSFRADVAGNYVAQLVVNDGSLSSAAASVTITASVANTAPVANAGADALVSTGANVTLNGSGSSDANSDPLTYAWTLITRPAGSMATLSNATGVQASFRADMDGNYVAQLVVNDGKVNSAADTVTITASSPAVACDSLKTEFQNVTWNLALKPACLTCHQNLSVFRLVPESTANFNDTNFSLFKTTAARTGGNNVSLILAKAANLDGNHAAGAVTPRNSAGYATLMDMVTKVSSCSDSAGGPTQTTVNGNGYSRLRKVTLALGARLPTAAEEAAVHNAGTNETAVTNTINTALNQVMNEPAFYTRLKEIYNDLLLTDYYAVNGRAFDMDLSNFANAKYFDSGNLTGAGYTSADAGTLRNWANYGLARAPLELVAYVTSNDRPFTEILTGDYVMVNSYSAAIYGATVASDPNFTFKYGDALTQHNPNVFMPVKLMDSKSRVYEHAGVLSTLPFLTRYPSTSTNRNRARARYAFLYFLDTDVQGLADRSGLNLNNVIGQFPTLQDPQCTVCHNVVDPVAGLFKNYSNSGVFSGNVTNWYNTRNPKQMLDPGYTMNAADALPGAQSPNALQFLGARMAADNRFAVATVKTLVRGLLGDDAADDTVLVEQLKQTFVASSYSMKALVKALVASNQFNGTNLGTSDKPTAYATLGTPVLSTPEQLDRKITAITGGYQWKSPGNKTLLDTNTYLLMYGGIDSMDVTTRSREPSSVMASIQERIAYQAACGAVPTDFAKTGANRALFPSVAITDLPDNGAGTNAIKQNIQYLHKRVLGEELALDDPEIIRTYNLFVAVKARSTGTNIPADCANGLATSDPIRVDANGTVRSWMAVVAYLMMDYKFLFE